MLATFTLGLLSSVQAQKQETFDIFTLNAPSGWKRETSDGVLRYSRNQGGLYCLFDVYRALNGTNNLEKDFQAEWQSIVVKRFNPSSPPELEKGAPQNGWQNQLGGAAFPYQGGNSLAILSTFSGGGRIASILMLTNDEKCLPEFEKFLAGLTLKKPAASVPAPPSPAAANTKPAANPQTAAQPIKSTFAFNTTNFDDGWVSVEQKDWVLSKKGNITVRLHYPSDALKGIYDSDKLLSAAWNTLVAPRYRDLEGYKQDFDTMNYFRPYLAAGTATSLESGQRVYVSLFRQDDSGWIEIVTPDRATFAQQFGVDIDTVDTVGTDGWGKLKGLRGLNRFAVAGSDLRGEWSSNASGMTQWVNAVTGLSAGATGFSSNVTFVFGPNGTYQWSLVMASGVIGAQTFQSAKSSGKLTMKGNWQINFSDIEKKPKLYNAYFEAGRGVRILWLQDSGYGSYSAFVRVK